MDVEYKVLQVGIHRGLCVYCGLLVGKEVIELYNPDCDGLKLLCLK